MTRSPFQIANPTVWGKIGIDPTKYDQETEQEWGCRLKGLIDQKMEELFKCEFGTVKEVKGLKKETRLEYFKFLTELRKLAEECCANLRNDYEAVVDFYQGPGMIC